MPTKGQCMEVSKSSMSGNFFSDFSFIAFINMTWVIFSYEQRN